MSAERGKKPMPIIEEDGGRLNTFAKEPRIEVLQQGESRSNGSWILIIVGALLVVGLVVLTVTIS